MIRRSTLSCILFICFLFLSLSTARAQYVLLPDSNFGHWLYNNFYSTDMIDSSTGYYLDTTSADVRSATFIGCNASHIHDLTGIIYFKSLRTLSCVNNLLTTLPNLPDSLNVLNCSENLLTSITSFPDSLNNLSCEVNQLSGLPPFPAALRTVTCYRNVLSSLPALPDSLGTIDCSVNQLSSLPAIPASLTFLNCGHNILDSLPVLPYGLVTLECSYNRLTHLGPLPNSIIEILYIDHNLLTSLTNLPSRIYDLNCISNQLTTLPAIPDSSSIGNIQLQCDSNRLTSLPPFPATLTYLTLTGNPGLTCLPEVISPLYTPPSTSVLVNLNTFHIAGTGITCIPNRFTAAFYDINPDSMPICGIGNSNGCPYYTASDSVWPGDANADHLVDNNDLLAIGLGYDSTGAVRPVPGIVWQADAATDWADSFSSYTPAVNYNHADCNGDGIINADDTLAIVQNFGLTHAKTNGISGAWRSGIPALLAVASPDTLHQGDTLTVTFVLGDTAIPVNNFYGLAFTYNFDPLIVDTGYTSIGFRNSWIGTDTDKIAISKIFNNAGQIKAAVTRIDHSSRSGSGTIATAQFIVNTHNIATASSFYYSNVGNISNVTAIDQNGNTILLNSGADTTQVAVTPLGVISLTGTSTIHLYPNPNKGTFTLATSGSIGSDYTISDMLGHVIVHDVISENEQSIELKQAAEGVYTLVVKGSQPIRFVVVR